MLLAATGFSKNGDAFTAGQEAAKQAIAKLKEQTPDFALLFTTVGYQLDDIIAGIYEEIGEVPLTGVSGDGVITEENIEEGLYSISLMLFKTDQIKFTNFAAYDVKNKSLDAGKEIGEKIAKIMNPQAKNKVIMVFPDGLNVNMTDLIAGFGEKCPGIPIIGGTAGDNLMFKHGYSIHNKEVISNGMSAVYLEGDFEFETLISHGSELTSYQVKVSKAEKNTIYELNDRPVMDVLSEIFGSKITQENIIIANLCLGFGQKIPTDVKYDNYDSSYILRAMMSADFEKGFVTIPAEVKNGDIITLVRRDNETILKCAKDNAEKIKQLIGSRKVSFALHFDCAGRGQCIFGDKAKDEPTILQKVFGQNIPWVGFYSFGEIGPLGKNNFFHNYTSIVVLFI